MLDEYNALIKNETWILVPRLHNVNIVHCLWLFRHKHNADGSLNRYKARLVANGSSQLAGIDVDETFSPVVKPVTIRTVLSLAISRHWPVHQLDVKNVFLNGYLSETVYMQQPLASSIAFLQRIITSLHAEFSMTDLGPLNYFLGVSVTRDTSGMFLSQQMLLRYLSVLRQFTISRSSAEAEYRGVANAVAETRWLRNLLRELHTPLSTATLVYCDNVSAFYLFSNPVQHQRMKHIEIDIHFVRDLVFTGRIRVLHVHSRYQYADIFTKRLPTALFDEFHSSLNVRFSPAQTAAGC
nr:ribonuclease H-like domain-containing protein [Tanacetum cinerariifolium]